MTMLIAELFRPALYHLWNCVSTTETRKRGEQHQTQHTTNTKKHRTCARARIFCPCCTIISHQRANQLWHMPLRLRARTLCRSRVSRLRKHCRRCRPIVCEALAHVGACDAKCCACVALIYNIALFKPKTGITRARARTRS